MSALKKNIHRSGAFLQWFRFFLAGAAMSSFQVFATSGEGSVQQWQAKALAEFPALGVSGSVFNSLFLEHVKRLREKTPEVFQDPSWPYRLAQRVAVSPEMSRVAKKGEAKKTGNEESGLESSDRTASKGEKVEKKGERSADIARMCLRVVEAEHGPNGLKDEPANWIQDDRIVPSARARALKMAAAVNEPAYFDALQEFVEQVMKGSTELTKEELGWLKAFLAQSDAHSAVAGLLGIPEVDMVLHLFAKADSPGFTQDWLVGGSGGFVPPMQIPAARRMKVLEKVVEGNFQLGTMHLSKEVCRAVCFRLNSDVAGAGFLLLEGTPLREFPESCLVNRNMPASKFSPQKSEWVGYMQKLIQIHEDLKVGKIAAFSTYFPGNLGAGGFEQYVLWECLRRESVLECNRWIDSLSAELHKHPGAQAKEVRRVLPALSYIINYQALADTRSGRSESSALFRPVPVAAARPASVAASPAKKSAPAPQIKAVQGVLPKN
jgi:hypothetical protein